MYGTIQRQVGIFSVMHFLVDGLCLCCLYLAVSVYSIPKFISIFLTYNILAFLSQPLTGMWVDSMRHKHWMLLMSVIMLTLAVAITSIYELYGANSSLYVFIIASLLGIGNSFFHVWGGKLTAVKTNNDIRALGVFVSTGAMGLAVAMVLCSWQLLYLMLLALSLLAVLYIMMAKDLETAATQIENTKYTKLETLFPTLPLMPHSMRYLPKTIHIVICLAMVIIMAVVLFRSFIAESFSSGIVKSNTMILAIGAAAMLGKVTGGWLTQKFGIVKAMVSVLFIVLMCLLAKSSNIAILLTGLFMINCTMPVTLYLANILLRGREGLAFGLLAAALIPGYVMAVL